MRTFAASAAMAVFLSPALYAAPAPVSAGAGVSNDDALREDLKRAQNGVKKAGSEVAYYEAQVAGAGSTYERLKAQRALEAAQVRLYQANQKLDAVKARVQPGTSLWDEMNTFKGTGAPDVGESGPVDPRVHQQNFVGEVPKRGKLKSIDIPSYGSAFTPGESNAPVSYGQGEAPSVGQGRVDPGRWKSRPTGGGAPTEVPGPIEAPEGNPLPQVRPQAAIPAVSDYLGLPIRWKLPELPHRGLPADDGKIAPAEAMSVVARRLESGDFQGALKEVEDLSLRMPHDPRLLFLKADLLNRLKRFTEAEAAAAAALAGGLDAVEAHEALGWAQLHLGKYAEALASAQRALALDPESALALVIEAAAEEQLGRPTQAKAAFAKAAALQPRRFAAAMQAVAKGAAIFDPQTGLRLDQPPAQGAPLWPLAAAGALGLGVWAFAAWRKK